MAIPKMACGSRLRDPSLPFLPSQVARFELRAVSSPTIQLNLFSPSSNLGLRHPISKLASPASISTSTLPFRGGTTPNFPAWDMDMGRGRHACYYSPLAIAAAVAIPDQTCLTHSSVICKAQASSPASSRHLTSTFAHVSLPVLRNSLHCSANSVYFLLLFPNDLSTSPAPSQIHVSARP